MGRLNMKIQMELSKEAEMYFKDVQLDNATNLEKKKEGIVLTQAHIEEWLQVFEEDRLKLDGCNMMVVKR